MITSEILSVVVTYCILFSSMYAFFIKKSHRTANAFCIGVFCVLAIIRTVSLVQVMLFHRA